MMQEDEDTPDVRPLLKALQLLLVPANLLTPLCQWQPTCIRVEENEPIGTRCVIELALSPQDIASSNPQHE